MIDQDNQGESDAQIKYLCLHNHSLKSAVRETILWDVYNGVHGKGNLQEITRLA